MANLGKVMTVIKGAYNGSTQYERLDVVTYNSSSWVAKQTTTGNTPPTNESENNTYWQLMAKGYTGSSFNDLTDKPTTISGYGITNAYTKTEIDNITGNLSDLETESNADMVSAVNEINTNVGNKDSLLTTIKTSIVNAISELVGKIGNLTSLSTTVKSSLVGAINEVVDNKVSKGSYYISVKDYGALGNLSHDDTSNIQDAINACQTLGGGLVYLPPGKYKISSLLSCPPGVDIKGAGEGISMLYTENNIPMLVLDTDNGPYNFTKITDIGFIGNVSGTRTSNDAILVKGTPSFNKPISYPIFKNILCQGTFSIIHSTKSSGVAENGFNWGKFLNLTCTNFGSNTVSYGLKFDYGSGTGNNFNNSTLVISTTGIEWGGSGNENIGDIIVSNIQFGDNGTGYSTAIKGTKGSTAYGSQITITGCQWDAGIDKGIDLNGFTKVTVKNCIWGGATVYSIPNCNKYSINAGQELTSVYTIRIHGSSNATNALFTLGFNSGFQCAYCELVTTGLIQGAGSRIAKTRFFLTYQASGGIALEVLEDASSGLSTGVQMKNYIVTNQNPTPISVQVQGATATMDIIAELRVFGTASQVTIVDPVLNTV